MRKDTQQQRNWSGNLERLEERLAMSADPIGGFLGGPIQQHSSFVDDLPPLDQHIVAEQPPALEQHIESRPDFWISSENQRALEDELRQVEQQLANAHEQTGLNQVRNNYGFTGAGQTVAVIDSGIAYDHFALGGGFGSDYRVVGGYDFTNENDADPYDDGPSGSHGTHVAGIVGGDAGQHNGVAPGVDLVALRVFDDAGAGFFSWVENALDWVYTNRNSFENPITTVNLSLGVASWNSDTIPSWANLEDEFAQLEAAGIFISVSAGNSFTSFNETGLSYPAASQYVVPVASVDDSGLLSYFSQRNSRVIAAPGRGILSTVPDYAGDNNGITDDYASFSGTSMAAPYVAGASVLIREAMEFAGYTNITQDTIYDHIVATADSVFDSATNQFYNRLNLDAAISALIPSDDFGSTAATGHDLGAVGSGLSVSGAITTLDDVDYFNFTAETTGTVTFAVSNATHDLTSSWTSNNLSTLSANGDSITLDVVAGESYSVGFASGDGLGYYDIDITAESAFTFTDWGIVSSSQLSNINVAGETWYRVEANSDGYFTVGSQFDAAGNQINLELYNSNLELVDSGTASNGSSRVDTYAAAGDELFLRVLGTNADVDFQLTNLVSIDGTTVNVEGTAGDDAFAFRAGNTHEVVVNGVAYSFDSVAVTDVNFDGGGGNDSITLTGTAGDETASLYVNRVNFSGAGFTANAENVETNSVYGNGGSDIAYLYDSAGNDTYQAYSDHVILSGDGFTNQAYGFGTTYSYSRGNGDIAYLYDSAGDDLFRAYDNRVIFSGDGFFNRATGFDSTFAYASTGYDSVYFYDSAGNDTFHAYHDRATFSGDDFSNEASGFDSTVAYSNSGTDVAYLYDSTGDDLLRAYADRTVLSGDGYYNRASGFASTTAQATSGYDRAYLYDSNGDDTYTAYEDRSIFAGENFNNLATNFDFTAAYASSGNDQAHLYDSSGDDLFRAYANRSVLSGNNFFNRASNFGSVTAYSDSGYDRAYFYDSAGDDIFRAYDDRANLSGDNFSNEASGFAFTVAYSNSGNDQAYLYDSAGDDLYRSYADRAILSGDNFYNRASGFDFVAGYSSTGNDFAYLHDSNGNDTLTADASGAAIDSASTGKRQEAQGFDSVTAYGNNGGVNSSHIDSIDYIFNQIGSWS